VAAASGLGLRTPGDAPLFRLAVTRSSRSPRSTPSRSSGVKLHVVLPRDA
jgi:hypothetical protein